MALLCRVVLVNLLSFVFGEKHPDISLTTLQGNQNKKTRQTEPTRPVYLLLSSYYEQSFVLMSDC